MYEDEDLAGLIESALETSEILADPETVEAIRQGEEEDAMRWGPGEEGVSSVDGYDWSWVGALEAGDRAALINDLKLVLLAVKADGSGAGRVNHAIREWEVTARQLQDPVRREVLTGESSPEDFVEVERPEGGV